MTGSNSGELSYSALISALHACSEKLKKNKRNLPKVIPQVTAELDNLLFSIRQHAMATTCPSHRVYEAQVLMNKAVVKRHAGHHLEEAQCYLLADSIWASLERERRGSNFPTSGDALARSVLCSAMACHVLLNNKYPAGQNPIPLKAMGRAASHVSSDPATFQTNGLWCPHLSRAWAVCYRLANILTDFNCIEMAADYFELAAIIVSVDAYGNDETPASSASASVGSGSPFSFASPSPSGAAKSTHHLHVPRPSNKHGRNGGVTGDSASMVSGGGDGSPAPTVTYSTTTTTTGSSGKASQSGDTSAAAQHHHHHVGQRHEGLSAMGLPPSSSQSQSSCSGHNHRARHQAQQQYHQNSNYSSSAASPPTAGRPSRGARAVPTIGVAPGMLYHFILALLCCARSCVLIQDYPRALTVIDELSSYTGYVQKELAEHIEGKIWEGRGRRAGAIPPSSSTAAADGLASANVNPSAAAATVVSEHAVQRLRQILGGAVGPNSGDVFDAHTAPATAVAEAEKIMSGNIRESGTLDTDENRAEQFDDKREGEPHTHNPTTTTTVAELPKSDEEKDGEKTNLLSTEQLDKSHPSQCPPPSQPKPPREPRLYSCDPAHHLFTLIEITTAIVHARVMKFAISIILGEPDTFTMANEQISYLRYLSDLWRLHTDHTVRVGLTAARNPDLMQLLSVLKTQGGGIISKEVGSSVSMQKSKESDNNVSSGNDKKTLSCYSHVNETSSHLYRLAATMEIIVEESVWASKPVKGTASVAAHIDGAEASSASHHASTSMNTRPSSSLTPSPAPLRPARELLSRRALEAAIHDLVEILSLLGISSRDVTILINRMHTSLLTNKLAAASTSASQTKIDAAKLQTAAALRTSIAAIPKASPYSQPATNFLANASFTAAATPSSSAGSPSATTVPVTEGGKESVK